MSSTITLSFNDATEHLLPEIKQTLTFIKDFHEKEKDMWYKGLLEDTNKKITWGKKNYTMEDIKQYVLNENQSRINGGGLPIGPPNRFSKDSTILNSVASMIEYGSFEVLALSQDDVMCIQGMRNCIKNLKDNVLPKP